MGTDLNTLVGFEIEGSSVNLTRLAVLHIVENIKANILIGTDVMIPEKDDFKLRSSEGFNRKLQ